MNNPPLIKITDAGYVNGQARVQVNGDYWFALSKEFTAKIFVDAAAEQIKPKPMGMYDEMKGAQSRQLDHQLHSDVVATKRK